MKKKFSALMALALSLAMVLTACSGGGGGETTAAAGGDTKAAGETAQAAAPSGDAVEMTMGTGGTTGTYYTFGGVIANVLNAKNIGVNINVQSTGDSSDALKDGKIDAFFCTAGAPTTAIVELATTKSINLLEIDDEHAAALAEAHPFYTTYPIPGGSYKGVDEDVQTVAIKATLICSPKLSEETVYNLTKALFDNQSEIAAAHAKGEELNLEYAVSGISVPFHPGTEKYFKEVGAIK